VTKFAAYVAPILLCESCKFGEKIFYSNWENEFFLRDCFLLADPVYNEGRLIPRAFFALAFESELEYQY